MNQWIQRGSKSLFPNAFKRVLAATAVASAILGSSQGAMAEVVSLDQARLIHIDPKSDFLTKSRQLRNLTDTAVALTDKSLSQKVANQLYSTAVHESGLLNMRGNLAGSSARGIFQILSGTAGDIVQRYASTRPNVMKVLEESSGMSRKKLMSLTRAELSNLVKENDLFAAEVSRYKYKMVPAAIPEGIENQAAYWRKHYHAGKGAGEVHIKQFKLHNKQFDSGVQREIARKAKAAAKQKTMGATKVMHNKKVMHTIKSQAKKLKHLFKVR